MCPGSGRNILMLFPSSLQITITPLSSPLTISLASRGDQWTTVGCPWNEIDVYYRPQTKFAKIMFLHVSVCQQGGGVACVAGERVWGHAWRGACVAGGQAWQGGMCGKGMHAPPQRILRDRSMSGRYASYWNAFLFFKKYTT